MKKPWLKAVRDLLIFIFPQSIIRLFLGSYDFAFIAHPLILEDLSRQYKNLKSINKNILKNISLYLWPVIGSEITGFRDHIGREVKGVVLFCPMSTRLLVLRQKKAIRKLIWIVKMAEKLSVKIVGLGAFVPIVTHDGKILAKHTNLNMTTGTSFSAIIAVTNILKLAEQCSVDLLKARVAVIGAGGSVGSICSRLLLDKFNDVILIDKKKEKLETLLAGPYLKDVANKKITISTKIEDVRNADLIIVTTNTPGTIIRSDHLKSGSLVVDAAQPRNVSAKVPFERKDVIVVESGVAEVPGLNTNFEFDLKNYSEVYSCLAEVLILLWSRIDGKQVGSFHIDYVYKLKEDASKIGINVPPFRNRAGYVTPEDIARLKQMIAPRSQLNEYSKSIKLSV